MSIARLPSVFPTRPQPIAIVCALCDEAQHFSEALEELGESKTPEICANFNIVQTGLGKERLTRCLNQSCEETPAAIIVAGTAGAVNDAFVPGDLIVLSSILDEAGNRLALSEDWLNILTSSFVPLNPKLGVGFTSSSAATSTIEKSALRKSYGVDCVDMETATIIEFANAHKIPVAAFRVVVDPHNQSIPPAALAGLNADGTVSALSTTIALIKRPHHLIGILKLGFQYRQAMKSLSRAARLLTRFLVDAPRANTESHY